MKNTSKTIIYVSSFTFLRRKFRCLQVFVYVLAFAGLSTSTGLAQTPVGGGTQPFDEPCRAFVYDFGGGSDNVVPCGPSANTTPSVPITFGDIDMGFVQNCAPADGNLTEVLWVTFIIKEGGSFEWQTVPGAEKFYYELYYAKDSPSLLNDGGECNDIQFMECGREFTGWRVQATPNPLKRWRFYFAFYFHPDDKDQIGDGVVKIRKSCGSACAGEPTADFTAMSDLPCIDPPTTTTVNLSTTTTTSAPPSQWFVDSSPLDPSISAYTGSGAEVNVSAMPTQTTTYYFTVVGTSLDCPAIDSVTVQVGNCCSALATGPQASNTTISICQTDPNQDMFVYSPNPAPGFASGGALESALLLVNSSGQITGSILNADIGTAVAWSPSPLSALPADTYSVYALSYDGDVATYLSSVTTISDIQSDPSCLELVYWGDDYLIEIRGGISCGTFPQN